MKLKLGKKYRDSITGFEGVATGRFEYLYGCIRYCLEGIDKDGKPDERIFDEQRLTDTPTAKTGGPRVAPPQRSQP